MWPEPGLNPKYNINPHKKMAAAREVAQRVTVPVTLHGFGHQHWNPALPLDPLAPASSLATGFVATCPSRGPAASAADGAAPEAAAVTTTGNHGQRKRPLTMPSSEALAGQTSTPGRCRSDANTSAVPIFTPPAGMLASSCEPSISPHAIASQPQLKGGWVDCMAPSPSAFGGSTALSTPGRCVSLSLAAEPCSVALPVASLVAAADVRSRSAQSEPGASAPSPTASQTEMSREADALLQSQAGEDEFSAPLATHVASERCSTEESDEEPTQRGDGAHAAPREALPTSSPVTSSIGDPVEREVYTATAEEPPRPAPPPPQQQQRASTPQMAEDDETMPEEVEAEGAAPMARDAAAMHVATGNTDGPPEALPPPSEDDAYVADDDELPCGDSFRPHQRSSTVVARSPLRDMLSGCSTSHAANAEELSPPSSQEVPLGDLLQQIRRGSKSGSAANGHGRHGRQQPRTLFYKRRSPF